MVDYQKIEKGVKVEISGCEDKKIPDGIYEVESIQSFMGAKIANFLGGYSLPRKASCIKKIVEG